MIQQGLYLRIVEGGQTFLMSTDDVQAIERRERMSIDDSGKGIAGWFVQGLDRWPAFRFGDLLGMTMSDWGHSVYFKTIGRPVGVAAESIQLMPHHQDIEVRPYRVLGNAFPGGALFNGVWTNAPSPALVVDARRLMSYLSHRDTAR